MKDYDLLAGVMSGALICYQSNIQRPMQLMMYLGNDLIEAVPVDSEQVPVPGYLGKIKRHLKEKHDALIKESGMQADFLVIPEKEKNSQ